VSETVTEPDWLAAQATDLAKLRAIMGAVRRCYAECPVDPNERTGPHMTTSMAEEFIAQLMTAEVASTNRERDVIMADLGDLLTALDLGDFARPESPHEVMRMCIRKAAQLSKLDNDLRLMLEATL
jgi:hypothetical protein